MQSRSSSRSFKPGLIGASPITDASLIDGSWLMVDSRELCRVRQSVYQPLTLNSQPTTLSRCNQFLHAALRRRRFVVQIHVRAPIQMTKLECRMTNSANARRKSGSRHSEFVIRHFVAPVPQQLQGGFRKPVFVGASPTRGSSLRSEPAPDWVRAKDALHSVCAKEGFLRSGSELWMTGQLSRIVV